MKPASEETLLEWALEYYSQRLCIIPVRPLALARDPNFNMSRIPDLSIYDDPLFYQFCDEYGIMIRQDFMFGNGIYPGDERQIRIKASRPINLEDIKVSSMNEIVIKHRK